MFFKYRIFMLYTLTCEINNFCTVKCNYIYNFSRQMAVIYHIDIFPQTFPPPGQFPRHFYMM